MELAIRRALVSVSDTAHLEILAAALARHGISVLATSGTARALAAHGVPSQPIGEYTGQPEILGGRVKTLHPKIAGGLLQRPTDEHRREAEAHGIPPIDLLVVNLYPFQRTVARVGVPFEEAIENIDIGGPTMIRAAAKNHERVAVVVDPADYAALAAELDAGGGKLGAETRLGLARKAFGLTASYDRAIAAWLEGQVPDNVPFPATLRIEAGRRDRPLRYGENPHQRSAVYRDLQAPAEASVAFAEVLGGKELSYNNLLDLEAALECVKEFDEAAAVVVKHGNPCGVAISQQGIADAYRRARETDPVAAFGGIVALNREVDEGLATALSETFLECVIAPGYDAAAREILRPKTALRLLACSRHLAPAERAQSLSVRSIVGGLLVQDRDLGRAELSAGRVVSKRHPTPNELWALSFAWRVCKHVKSNAIVFATDTHTVGIGAGQMSRVDSVKLAAAKAQRVTRGAVMASDAFFPFRDGLDEAAKAGITAVVHPGGSKRDDEIIAAADEHGIAMILTGMRHFRH